MERSAQVCALANLRTSCLVLGDWASSQPAIFNHQLPPRNAQGPRISTIKYIAAIKSTRSVSTKAVAYPAYLHGTPNFIRSHFRSTNMCKWRTSTCLQPIRAMSGIEIGRRVSSLTLSVVQTLCYDPVNDVRQKKNRHWSYVNTLVTVSGIPLVLRFGVGRLNNDNSGI